MKDKMNSNKVIEKLKRQFQKDKVANGVRIKLESAFACGKLNSSEFDIIFPPKNDKVVCNSPDDRIELINEYYKSLESLGINTYPAHSGDREIFIDYIDDLIRHEPVVSPFIIVEHSFNNYLDFLRYGIIEIGWELYTFPGDRMAGNGKIAECMQFEAKRFGFWIPKVSVKDRKMKLVYRRELMDRHPIETSINPYADDITTILIDTKPSFGSHLKRFKLPKAVDSMDIQVLSNVKEYGFHIVWIQSGGTEPDYCFTIGLEYSYKHPEIILIGLPISTTKSIINNLGSKIRTGQRFIDDDQCINISSQRLMMKKMHPSHYRDYLGYFLWFYRSLKTPPDVMQLVWSDESGKFPWDEGCSDKCVKSQNILNK